MNLFLQGSLKWNMQEIPKDNKTISSKFQRKSILEIPRSIQGGTIKLSP